MWEARPRGDGTGFTLSRRGRPSHRHTISSHIDLNFCFRIPTCFKRVLKDFSSLE